MKLELQIEALLYFKGEAISLKKMSELLSVSEEDVKTALNELEKNLSERGVRLLRKDDEVMLGTAPELSSLIEKIVKEDLARDLGKAGLETLSIVLYRGPIPRREIDYIRGVNSAFILRNLMIRGLVEKVPDEKDQRTFLYRPTFELLSYLGITKIEDLPEYAKVIEEVKKFQEQKDSGKEDEKPEKGIENQTESTGDSVAPQEQTGQNNT